MRQIGDRLVAFREAGSPRCVWRSDQLAVGLCPLSEGRGPACRVIQQSATATCTGRTIVRPVPEAADVTEDDRLQCRALIEAASFYAVDYEDDGACWERLLPSGDCLVLAVWNRGFLASRSARSGPSSATRDAAR